MRASLTYRRYPWSAQAGDRLREIERDFHIHAFGQEPARVNLDLTIEERQRYLARMCELARKNGVPVWRTSSAAGLLVAFMASRAWFAGLALLWAASAGSAFCQPGPGYAWTNFVGEPGFEESADGPDTLANTGSADGRGDAARFYHPRGVTVDDTGNLFVADTRNHTIRKVTPDGLVTTLAGGPGARGSNGVANVEAPRYGPDGEPEDGPGASGTHDGSGRAARFCQPMRVAVDRADNVFVADTMNNMIRKVTAAGVVTTLAGNPTKWFPRAGFAAWGGPLSHQPPGAPGYRTGLDYWEHAADDGTGRTARFFGPAGVAGDRAGNIFVADGGNNRIRKVTAAGVVTTLAGGSRSLGSADGPASTAGFNYPNGVAVDGAGNVFVTDGFNHTIRKVTPKGWVTTVAGRAGSPGTNDGTGNVARFRFPAGIAVDLAGNLFVADCGNATIRKVTPAGVVTTIGGTPGVTGWADGIGTSAQFCGPWGIAVDKAGRLYVTDSGNNRISKGTPVR